MPRLRDIDGRFLKITDLVEKRMREVDSLEDAQGVEFLCPKCFAANNGPVGTHAIICWFRGRGVPDDWNSKPGRWNPSGTGLDDLTFVGPGAVSVLLTSGCGWHGFVKDGSAD